MQTYNFCEISLFDLLFEWEKTWVARCPVVGGVVVAGTVRVATILFLFRYKSTQLFAMPIYNSEYSFRTSFMRLVSI